MTYNLVNDRSISNLYVNDSGRKDDIGLHGKYVFINLTIKNQDPPRTGTRSRSTPPASSATS